MKKTNLLKHLMLLVVGLSFALGANAANHHRTMLLWNHDQVIASFELRCNPNVTFTEDQLVVTTDQADVCYYSLPDMWKITYDNKSGVEELNSEKGMMHFNGDVIVFSSLEAGANISVFSANGALVMNTRAAAGEYTLPLSSLSQGVYLVNVNGKTYKIVKK